MKRVLAGVALGSLALVGPASAQEPAPSGPPVEAILTPPRFPELNDGRGEESGGERSEWETDRDSFTPSTKTAGRRRWIVESAYSFIDNRRSAETHSFPEFLARRGITDRLEVRLGWNYEVGGASNGISGGSGGESLAGDSLERASEISYGLKFGLTEQRRFIPESAIIVSGFTPTSGEETATQLVGAYVFGWELPNKWILDSAMRFSADSERGDRFEDWAPSVVLKAPLGEAWNAHVEYFGLFSRNKERDRSAHYVSPGLHYLMTEDIEIGFRLGWGLNDQAARFFINAGAGMRF